MKRPLPFLPALALILAGTAAGASDYHDDAALTAALKLLARRHDRVTVTSLATTPGGRDVPLLTVAPAGETAGRETAAVLVVADPLGTCPLATEAALELARELVSPPAGAAPSRADSLTWYLVPRLDPDGTARFFASPVLRDGRNGQPRDTDADAAVDEDPPEDLDGDGVVRVLLVPDPGGRWLLDDGSPPLYRQAKPEQGERGRYRRLVEGDDTDGDGAFNEDGPGGVVPGRNFPHGFTHWTDDAGPWAAYCPETRGLLAFAFAHPEIALILELSSSNTLRKVPEAGKQPQAGGGKYKLPKWMAKEAGLDPEREYALDELVEMARDFTGNRRLTGDDVLSFLGLGIPTAPAREDLAWWQALSKQYGDGLKSAGLDGKRVDPAPVRGGSLADWGYYQFGVPSLAVDLWSVPVAGDSTRDTIQEIRDTSLTPDRIEQMTADQIVALGEEKIAAFLRANDAPASVTPAMVIQALQGGMLTPGKIAGMMRKQAEKKEAGGVDPDLKALATFAAAHPDGPDGHPVWADWREVSLADGRTALTGGPDPFALRNPPAAMLDSLLSRQVPLLVRLVDWLPRLGDLAVRRRDRGGGVEEVTVVIPNTGRLPYPTAMGKRTKRVPPVVVELQGAGVIQGRPRQVVPSLPAGGTATVTWLVHGKRGKRVTVTASAPSLGTRRVTFTLGSTKGGRR